MYDMNLLDTTKFYKDCTLCPRNCHADRYTLANGYCRMSAELSVAKIYKHMWEEPCITGEGGSGTVFFSGCNLCCLFCQNSKISHENKGFVMTASVLSESFLELQEKKASNINLVTGVCHIPLIVNALIMAKKGGLTIPVVYNSSGYESVSSLKLLDGLIDIYMPDFKYMSEELSLKYSKAADYPEIAKKAIAEMYSQTGPAVMGDDGLMKKGVLVRHPVLPDSVPDSKKVLRYLKETYGDNIIISIMNQYTPVGSVKDHPVLGRKVTEDEYSRVVEFADKIGIEKGFVQEGEAVSESFIPNWDLAED